MYLNWSKAGRQLALLAVAFMFAILPVMAQSHVVTEQDLQQQLATVSQSRAQNLRQVQAFFSSEQAQKAFQNGRIDPQQLAEWEKSASLMGRSMVLRAIAHAIENGDI